MYFLNTDIGIIEQKTYKIIQEIDGIEIRHYVESTCASYYDNEGDNPFTVLADYIFGGNQIGQKIEMTSPVAINMFGNEEMIFLMPTSITIENHPKPNNDAVKIFKSPNRLTASITFSGYADNKACLNNKQQLIDILKQNLISHKNDFQLLVYDPPYKKFNRTNEIIVSINGRL